jgi:LPS-assembly protein
MKNKFIIFLSIIFFFLLNEKYAFSNEFIFDTSEINILDKGNIIEATNGTATSIKDNINIAAKKFLYNKKLLILKAEKGVAKVINENIEIIANKFVYNENTSSLNAIGNVTINDLTKKTLIKSENIFYYIDKKIIKSSTQSSIEDDQKNLFLAQGFTYNLNDSLIKVDKVKIVDLEKNIIQIDKAYINLISKKLIGKDLSIDFNNVSFNKENEPRLKGVTVSSGVNETLITKGLFTTCKKNDNCPPWQLSAKKIRHDKKKKTIYYNDAWLKLYDKPVFYFPKFFHPDPTVNRQSGFLMPRFEGSNTLGTSFHLPYYNVISDNKDFTVTPRFYKNEKLLVQTEYRTVNPKTTNIIDFSFFTEKNRNGDFRSHFFSKTSRKLDFDNFDESELSLELQQTTNDTYLKTYKLKSPIITDSNLLASSLGISAYREDLSFNTNLRVYEDLGVQGNDRYEFIYPSYDLIKDLDNPTKLNGNFSIYSSGFFKNYDTNVYEKVIINDFTFNSNPIFTESGFKNNYNILIKNINTDSDNSKKYKDSSDSQLASLIEYNSSYPLKKGGVKYNDILKPKMSLKYSPNKTRDIRNEDRRIDINNIFSMNRISVDDTVEGGTSLTYGIDFLKTEKLSDRNLFGANIANIFRFKEDKNLPRNSKLGNRTSDIVGGLNYAPNNIYKINYDFSLDNNLSETNYELLSSEFKINNFITTFEYLNEDNTTESESYLSNKTSYSIDENNNFLFEISENKKTKLTEFYNLIYQYTNDCLTAAIEYNKNYYSDRDLKPEENIFFKLTIIPFGETSSPNLR